ncbi:uncharacterized protein BKCO1_6400048 [Diplodia corticola]|uniref:Uncharacterized protein n=1 Tax=Diplodia corticola TaxID=236234 RepID=A0A1J9RRP0_9PEZI|nr:uncharacterized protein BKCO1_6400048 [Diplodia corticola]OJD30197.1 hypothetical protein BKCO1_6400048 [Diplodia corticola]
MRFAWQRARLDQGVGGNEYEDTGSPENGAKRITAGDALKRPRQASRCFLLFHDLSEIRKPGSLPSPESSAVRTKNSLPRLASRCLQQLIFAATLFEKPSITLATTQPSLPKQPPRLSRIIIFLLYEPCQSTTSTTMELSGNEIFIALFLGFVGILVLAMILIYFRKKHLKKVNEQLRAKRAAMEEA